MAAGVDEHYYDHFGSFFDLVDNSCGTLMPFNSATDGSDRGAMPNFI